MVKALYVLGAVFSLGALLSASHFSLFDADAIRTQFGLLMAFNDGGGRALDGFGITQAQTVWLDKRLGK